MKELLGRWKHLRHRYAALTRRERIFLALAIVFGPLLIGNALFVDPQFTRGAAAERSLTSQNGSLATMQAQLRSLQQELSVDPDAGKKAELAALGEQREKLDAQLKQLGNELVRPEEMNGLLERLLARQTGLRLISLKTLPPQSIMADKEGGARTEGKQPERAFDLYRHGVEIRLEGNFAQLQAYLVQLEKMPQRLLWGSLNYRVIEYPRAEMTLTVYTLSPDKTWLTL